jgi:predicted transposase YdaD
VTVLRESPWYQEILKEGLAKGEQQGLQQGEASLVLRLLSKRFGTIDSAMSNGGLRLRASNSPA